MELADYNLKTYLFNNLQVATDGVNLFKKICEGLQHAHTNNVAHRDLYWNNILLVNNDNQCLIKLTDFGRAKDFDSLSDITPQNDTCFGINEIRSPELIFEIWGKPTQDNHMAGDLYALGIVLYFVFQGSPSFYNFELLNNITNFLNNNIATLYQLSTENRCELYKQWVDSKKNYQFKSLELSLFEPEINIQINNIIKKLCNIDYKKRYENVRQLLSDLDNIKL